MTTLWNPIMYEYLKMAKNYMTINPGKLSSMMANICAKTQNDKISVSSVPEVLVVF